MAITDRERLRMALGERIPQGGTDDDTLFSDEEIDDFLAQAGGDQTQASLYGWQAKAAELANLADRATGSSKTSFSDLHAMALKQVETFGTLVVEASKITRTRVTSIVRSER